MAVLSVFVRAASAVCFGDKSCAGAIHRRNDCTLKSAKMEGCSSVFLRGKGKYLALRCRGIFMGLEGGGFGCGPVRGRYVVICFGLRFG